MNEIIKNYEKQQIQEIIKNSKITDFNPGDTVKVNIKIKEGDKERVQAFQGVCIAKKIMDLTLLFQLEKFQVAKVLREYFPFIVI